MFYPLLHTHTHTRHKVGVPSLLSAEAASFEWFTTIRATRLMAVGQNQWYHFGTHFGLF